MLTFDGDALDLWWLADYPRVDSRRTPSLSRHRDDRRGLGGKADVGIIPVPIDCVDGFTEAYYARPESFLDAAVRRSQSAWSFVRDEDQSRFVQTLGDDLESGAWDRKYGEWRTKPYFEGSLRLIVSAKR